MIEAIHCCFGADIPVARLANLGIINFLAMVPHISNPIHYFHNFLSFFALNDKCRNVSPVSSLTVNATLLDVYLRQITFVANI